MNKINNREAHKLLPYLYIEKEFNVFQIFDILNLEIIGDLDIYISGTLSCPECVLLRHSKYFIVYSADGFMEFDEIVKIINKYKNECVLSGKGTVIEKFIDKMKWRINDINKDNFAKLSEPVFSEINNKIELAKDEDVEELLNLLNNIDEFSKIYSTLFKKDMKNKSSRRYLIRENNKIVSTASTKAESMDVALISAVATHQAFRRKGCSTAILTKLCSDLFKEGKSICLSYDNPEAEKIYLKLGFKKIGFWQKIKLMKISE